MMLFNFPQHTIHLMPILKRDIKYCPLPVFKFSHIFHVVTYALRQCIFEIVPNVFVWVEFHISFDLVADVACQVKIFWFFSLDILPFKKLKNSCTYFLLRKWKELQSGVGVRLRRRLKLNIAQNLLINVLIANIALQFSKIKSGSLFNFLKVPSVVDEWNNGSAWVICCWPVLTKS